MGSSAATHTAAAHRTTRRRPRVVAGHLGLLMSGVPSPGRAGPL
ncbi:hypothetical protein [Streptantibioticus silvisoli]|nr:hypothetical protein [Streptantibioticus silvisoli]